MVGVCPQFNVQFGVLTVKENLKTFAEIKGIRSKEVEQEVSVCPVSTPLECIMFQQRLLWEAQRLLLVVSSENQSWF